jgi:hypothetical protein
MRELPSFEKFINEAIEIVYYSEVLDNWGKTESSEKPDAILKVLQTPDEWSDDMMFQDKGGKKYDIDELIGKQVKVGNKTITIKESVEVNEGVFHRLPKDIIKDELYLTSKNLTNFYDRTAAGNDVDPGVIDTIIRNLDKVKKAVKKFNSKDEVMGTVYEAEKVVFDEIGPELEALKKKISDLMKNTTDKKWVTALGSAYTALSNLDRNLSQADAKLGVIPMKESEEVNEASVQVAGKSKPSGAQVLATVIIDHLMKNEYLKPGADKVRKELISDVQNVIMDSTF